MRRAKRDHPAEGRLRAWLDGELGPWPAMRVRVHLWRCARCRDRAAAARGRGARAAAILDGLSVHVNVAEAWARVGVRAGRSAPARRGREWAWAGAGAAAASALAAALWLGGVTRLEPGPRPSPASAPALHPGGLTGDRLLDWVARGREAGDRIERDLCCLDLDGGGIADDGLFTLSDPGERVAMVIVYEDTDGRGALSPTSLVRYVGRSP